MNSPSLFYVDASIVVRVVFEPRGDAAQWLERVAGGGASVISSRLLRLETVRALRREGLPPTGADEVLDRIALLAISEQVLAIAEGIQRQIRSLDALHLATALHTTLSPTVVTHDRQMAEVAASLGLDTLDPT